MHRAIPGRSRSTSPSGQAPSSNWSSSTRSDTRGRLARTRQDEANDMLLRGAALHADIASLIPENMERQSQEAAADLPCRGWARAGNEIRQYSLGAGPLAAGFRRAHACSAPGRLAMVSTDLEGSAPAQVSRRGAGASVQSPPDFSHRSRFAVHERRSARTLVVPGAAGRRGRGRSRQHQADQPRHGESRARARGTVLQGCTGRAAGQSGSSRQTRPRARTVGPPQAVRGCAARGDSAGRERRISLSGADVPRNAGRGVRATTQKRGRTSRTPPPSTRVPSRRGLR